MESQTDNIPQVARTVVHCCYGLVSDNKDYPHATYIGYTVNPRRRIRQHNGAILNGANKTKKKRPWSMLFCVFGFPSNHAALQFEWAWQHPRKSRHVHETINGWLETMSSQGKPLEKGGFLRLPRGEAGLAYSLCLLLHCRPWKFMGLQLLCLSSRAHTALLQGHSRLQSLQHGAPIPRTTSHLYSKKSQTSAPRPTDDPQGPHAIHIPSLDWVKVSQDSLLSLPCYAQRQKSTKLNSSTNFDDSDDSQSGDSDESFDDDDDDDGDEDGEDQSGDVGPSSDTGQHRLAYSQHEEVSKKRVRQPLPASRSIERSTSGGDSQLPIQGTRITKSSLNSRETVYLTNNHIFSQLGLHCFVCSQQIRPFSRHGEHSLQQGYLMPPSLGFKQLQSWMEDIANLDILQCPCCAQAYHLVCLVHPSGFSLDNTNQCTDSTRPPSYRDSNPTPSNGDERAGDVPAVIPSRSISSTPHKQRMCKQRISSLQKAPSHSSSHSPSSSSSLPLQSSSRGGSSAIVSCDTPIIPPLLHCHRCAASMSIPHIVNDAVYHAVNARGSRGCQHPGKVPNQPSEYRIKQPLSSSHPHPPAGPPPSNNQILAPSIDVDAFDDVFSLLQTQTQRS